MRRRGHREHPHSSGNAQPEHEDAEQVPSGSGFRRVWHRAWLKHLGPEARFAGWVARFTGLLAIIALVQAWAFMDSERAFLTISDVHFPEGGLIGTKPLAFLLLVKNSGKDAAFVDDLNVSWEMPGNQAQGVPTPLPDTPTYATYAQRPRGLIAANSDSTISWEPATTGFSLPLAPATVVNITQNRSVRFYVFGYVTYHSDMDLLYRVTGSDFFAHHTFYCFFYNPSMVVKDLEFTVCGLEAYEHAD